MLHIHELILLVHLVNTADVLVHPGNRQVVALVTELDLLNCCVRRSFKLDRLLLCPDIIQQNFSVLKSDSQHEAIGVELDRSDGCFSFYLCQ
jgi:hypothetical protein